MDPESYLRVSTTLFATLNALVILPVVVSLTEDVAEEARFRVQLEALLTASAIGLILAGSGRWLFGALGIDTDDLRVAGGLVLLIFAIYDLLFSTRQRKEPSQAPPDDEVGLVPLGIPILVGPAGLTVLMVTAEAEGLALTAAAFAPIVAFNALALFTAPHVMGAVGKSRARAFGKVMSLLLAALAVSMIRHGVEGFLQTHAAAAAPVEAPTAAG